jgi:hypothetical protein
MLRGTAKEIEGVGGGAGESVLVEDLFGQGADQGLATKLAAVIHFGALDDFVDMQGPLGGDEYVINDIHIRLLFGAGWGGWALLGAAQGAQGSELSQGGVFEDLDEIVFIERVHGVYKKFDKAATYSINRYMSNT